MNMSKIALLSATAGITLVAVPAHAQDEDATGQSTLRNAPIVVTAQRREQNVQDVPIAVSAFTSEALQERGISDVAQLSSAAPNVTLDAGTPFSGSSSVLSAYIRGIGANDFAFNIDPGVGIYLDGVYLARSVGANQDLLDVERVEVLRGPQGTLFGRNTIGGAVNIVTRAPGDEFHFVGDITTGSFDRIQVRGSVDIPLSNGFAMSLTGGYHDRDGYLRRIPYPVASNAIGIENFLAADYDTSDNTEGGDHVWNVRARFDYDDGGRFRASVTGDYSKIDTSQIANTVIATTPDIVGGAFDVFAGTYNCAIQGIIPVGTECGGGPPSFAYLGGIGGLSGIFDNPTVFGVNVDADPTNDLLPFDSRFITGDIDTSYANGNNFSRLENFGFAGTVEFDLSDNVTLKSITAYRELHWTVGMDLDGSPLNFLHTSFDMNQWQFSEELQLLGNALDGDLDFAFGAYYFKEAGDLHDYVTFAEGLLQVDGPNDLSTENYALFGQVDWRVADWLGFTVGARYTHESKDFEGFQSDNNGLTYKILNFIGVPECASLTPISDACRIAAGFPNQGQPLRYYIAGTQTKTFDNFSPRVGIQLYPTEDIMFYGTWSRGYKTGGWTTRLSNPLPTAPDFNEEEVESFELGIKSTLFDGLMTLNGAVFTTRYTGIQLNFQQGVSPTIQNAGTARIRGAEIEMSIAPSDVFRLDASIGMIDAEYTSVLPGSVVAPNPLQGGVFAGGDLPKTPTFSLNISPRVELPIGDMGSIILIGDFTHTSSLWNDTERTFLLRRGGTNLLNASVTYRPRSERWSLTAGGTNLFDERYLVTGQAQIAGGQIYGTYSRPAEWYLRLGVDF